MQKDMFQKKKPKKNMDLEKLTIFIQVVKKKISDISFKIVIPFYICLI